MLNLPYNALSLSKRTNIRLTERKEYDGQINSIYIDLVTLLSMQRKASRKYLSCVWCVCVPACYYTTMYACVVLYRTYMCVRIICTI